MITHEQLIAWESGTLTPEEKARLEADFAADDSALREWNAQRQMDEALRVTLGGDAARGRVLRAIMAVVAGPGRERVKAEVLRTVAPRRWHRAVLAGVLAATAVIMLAFWLRSPAIATLTAAEGAATIVRAGKEQPAHRGSCLIAGDTLHVTNRLGATATVRYPDATQLLLSSGSLGKFETGGSGGKEIRLTEGSLHARVSKQPAGKPLTITTPQATVTVVGTEFSLDVADARTQLEVHEGLVRMTRKDGRDAVEVGAGQSAVFMSGTIRPPDARTHSAFAASKDGTRSLFMWPFASDCLWNRSLGANARFEPIHSPGFNPHEPLHNAIIGRPIFNEVENFPVHRVLVNDHPVLDVRFADRWKPGFAADRPVIVIADPLGMRVAELRGADRLPSGELTAKEVITSRLDGPGTAGLAQSGVSALGGVIRYGELTRGIPHALAASVRRDSLGGNLRLGTRLALPPSLDVTRLGTGNVDPGVKLAHALQDYGVFITDTGEQPFALFAWYENTPPDLASEIAALLPYLQVVTDPGDPPRIAPAPPP